MEFGNKVKLLIIKFFLFTVIGYALLWVGQNRHWTNSSIANKNYQKNVAAQEYISILSDNIDERFFAMHRCYLGLRDEKDSIELNARWEYYNEILKKWNRKVNQNKVKTKLYIGQKESKMFEELHFAFKEFGRSLDYRKRVPEKRKDLSKVESGITNVETKMKNFMEESWNIIYNL